MTEPVPPQRRRPRSVFRELSEEESARLAAARAEAPTVVAEALQRVAPLERALEDQTVSGQLRRAIVASGLQCVDLARQAGIAPKELADFMVGQAELGSTAFDRLAESIGCRLVAEGV